MFICNECNEIFEEPDTYFENHGEYFGFPAIEEMSCCPHCKSGDYEEAYECDVCGEYTNNMFLCDGCKEEFEKDRICVVCGEAFNLYACDYDILSEEEKIVCSDECLKKLQREINITAADMAIEYLKEGKKVC